MFVLRVISKFNGKDEGKTLNPGDTLTTDDVTRVNALVAQKLCLITSFEVAKDAATTTATDNATIAVNGVSYDVEEVKKALASIGVSVAANAKVKGVTSALEKLSDEQTSQLEAALTANTKEEE